VTHWLHHPKVKGSCPASAIGRLRGEMGKSVDESSNSAVVEHLPHHSKVKGSNPASAIGNDRGKMTTMLINVTMAQWFNNCFTNPKSKVHNQPLS